MQNSARRTALAALFFLPMVTATALGQDAVADLRSGLLAAPSATQFLTGRCAELHLAAPAVVLAQTVPAPDAVTAEIRGLLKVDASEAVRHRHVRLTCGGHVLSEADNWYVPARLTVEMNRTLDSSDTSFGTVVRPLDFHRRTLETTQPSDGAAVLQVKALLLTPQETPFSLVVENYSRELLGEK